MESPYARFATHHGSRRLRGYDYASPGWYFVTACTHQRRHLFGQIRGGVMGLSPAGCAAHACWHALPDHFPHVILDAFVVMPDHVHMVIGLTHTPAGPSQPAAAPAAGSSQSQPAAGPVAPLYTTALLPPNADAFPDRRPNADAFPDRLPGAERMARLSPSAGSLASVVRTYKGAVTRAARRGDPAFGWQPRFYDHVVRSDRALGRIRTYVRDNPARWSGGPFCLDRPPPRTRRQ